MLTEFAEANNFTMQSVLASFKRNTNGSYSGKGSKVAFATYNKLDDKYIADLRRSANETVDNTISSVIEASIQHLQDGSEQRIAVTDENRDILTQLHGKWGELDNTTNEFIINTVSQNIEEVIAAIKATDGISQS
jgi:predicted ATPase